MLGGTYLTISLKVMHRLLHHIFHLFLLLAQLESLHFTKLSLESNHHLLEKERFNELLIVIELLRLKLLLESFLHDLN